jgi:hypothetical protein
LYGVAADGAAREFALSCRAASRCCQYRGKVVLIEMLYHLSTARPLAHLSRFHRVKAARFSTAGRGVQRMASMLVPDFIKQFQPNFPLGYAQRDRCCRSSAPSIRDTVPQMVIVDRKGMICGQTLPTAPRSSTRKGLRKSKRY